MAARLLGRCVHPSIGLFVGRSVARSAVRLSLLSRPADGRQRAVIARTRKQEQPERDSTIQRRVHNATHNNLSVVHTSIKVRKPEKAVRARSLARSLVRPLTRLLYEMLAV